MEKKYKNGDKHPAKDLVFWSYLANGAKEQWCSPKSYKNKIKKRKEYQKSEKGREYQRQWYLKNKEKKLNQGKVNLKKRGEQAPLRCLYSSAKSTCKRRRFKFLINVEFIEQLWVEQEGKCFYTGIEMKHSAFKKDPFQVSIDRVDSKKDYTEDNTVLCCQSINYAKNSYKVVEFTLFLEALKLINK